MSANLTPRGTSDEDRLLLLSEPDGDGCWIWMARRDRDGYGRLAVGDKRRAAHRVSYMTWVGPIPDGIETAPRKIADVRRKKPPPEGKVRCSGCGKYVTQHGMRLRRHNDKSGFPCPEVRVPGVEVHLSEVPPVNLPPEPKWRPASPSRASAGPRREKDEPARLDAGSSCRECGKWLPGERSLCGRCSVLQGRAS